jgi:hypothetical protein
MFLLYNVMTYLPTTARATAFIGATHPPQQLQVSMLARDGLSNPEIGTQLSISPRAVQYHLRKFFSSWASGPEPNSFTCCRLKPSPPLCPTRRTGWADCAPAGVGPVKRKLPRLWDLLPSRRHFTRKAAANARLGELKPWVIGDIVASDGVRGRIPGRSVLR